MIKSAILEEQKAQLKKEELAARILNQSRNELYLKLRYLDLALGNLALAPGTVSPAGTDGGALHVPHLLKLSIGEECIRLVSF